MSTSNTANIVDVQVASALANANSTGVVLSFTRGVLNVWGTFGGGTYTLQTSPDNGTTWIPFNPTISFTAAGCSGVIYFPSMNQIRLSGSGGTGNSVTATATPA